MFPFFFFVFFLFFSFFFLRTPDYAASNLSGRYTTGVSQLTLFNLMSLLRLACFCVSVAERGGMEFIPISDCIFQWLVGISIFK